MGFKEKIKEWVVALSWPTQAYIDKLVEENELSQEHEEPPLAIDGQAKNAATETGQINSRSLPYGEYIAKPPYF